MAIEDNPESRAAYGEWLKDQREAAGLTQEALGERAILSRTHIAHIEGGRRTPTLDDAQRLDAALGTKGVLAHFLPTLDNTAIAGHFKEASLLEPQATVIREYAPKLVPGILQTEAYAREVLSSGHLPKSDEECDKLVSTRLARGRILEDFEKPVMWALFDEAVLRRPIGGPAVMAEQLHHIVKLGESRRIRCHVLPFSIGFHALVGGFVSLMWFEDLPPVAYIEGLKTGKVWDYPPMVQDSQAAYDHALGDALSHRKSLTMIRSIAEEYAHEPH